jgi:PPIC-type PPIASE domain
MAVQTTITTFDRLTAQIDSSPDMKTTENPQDSSLKAESVPIGTTEIASLEHGLESEFEKSLQQLCQRIIAGDKLIGLLQQYRLLPVLQRELIVDREIANIVCSQPEVLGAYKAFYQKYQINSDADRALWLEKNHFSLDQFEHLVLKAIKLDRFKQTVFGSRVDSYFLQRKGQLDRAVYSILRVKDVHLAQELYFRIRDGEATFTELVKQYSGGEEAEMGGLVGPHEMSIPHPALVQKIIGLKAGELSPPLQIADWFVIVQLEKHLPARLDKVMRTRLTDELYEQWVQEKLNQSVVESK